MEEQEFLHQLSVRTNVNIELLKALLKDEKYMALIKAGKYSDAAGIIRRTQARVGLREAVMIAQAFVSEFK
jgi:hypothetical protein